MDVKCVRVLRPYEDEKPGDEMTLYIDEDARYALNRDWGAKAEALGRRKITVTIQPLKAMDQEGFIARGGQALIDALYIEYGEEIILH
ncbi:hypothetical protein C4J81_04590 [Deltaproteobacteria bacterium Smac51]|nr:hypothetical protein C4J81_04590 [Deltaproteobacteria bacterium Smac51]